jgi:flavin reductase (DIM6/NTAB) family NADH-FMN oxidoreductase RutF
MSPFAPERQEKDFRQKTSIGSKEIVFPAPVFIVGTYCEDGKPNVMNVAWGGICSSNPPCVAISIRKSRCTYWNILKRKAFTINIPSEKYVKEADYFGMVSGKTADKFKVTGLTPVKGDFVDAPYVGEFPMNLECRVRDMFEIGEHTQIIGEIVDLKVDAEFLGHDGNPVVGMIKPMVYDHATYRYYAIGHEVDHVFSSGKRFIDNRE